MEEKTISLKEVATFMYMETGYLKVALNFFAPELMEPYKDLDLEDESLNDKFVFPDTKETWKLIAFTVCNSFIEDMAEATSKLDEVKSILGIN